MINLQANPVFASASWSGNTEEEKELKRKWFLKFTELPLEVRLGLVSMETENNILNLGKKFKLNKGEELGEVSRIIREYFVEKKDRKGFIQSVAKRAGEKLQIKPNRITEFVKEVLGLIELINKYGSKKVLIEYEALGILDAVNKYESVADQIISASPIQMESSGKMVKPTIKNWLESYFEKMGTNRHSAMERNEYLFETLNAKSLSDEEKKRVAIIIESFDGGNKILILKGDAPEMIFEEPGVKGRHQQDNDSGVVVDDRASKSFNDLKVGDSNVVKEKSGYLNNFQLENKMKIRDNEEQVNLKEERIKSQNKKDKKNRNVLDLNEFVK